MNGKGPQGPGRPRDPQADGAILSAAVELLIERGIDGSSIERIAKRAGVAKVTVYRRWKSKEDLLAQAIEAVRQDIAATEGSGRPAGEITEVIEELLPIWGRTLAEPRFRALSARLLSAGQDHPKLLAAYVEHHVRPREARARTIMLAARQAGALPADTDVDMVIDMMSGAVMQFLLLTPQPPGPAEISRYLRRLLRQAGFALRQE